MSDWQINSYCLYHLYNGACILYLGTNYIILAQAFSWNKLLLFLLLLLNNGLRVSDVWLRVKHNVIYKYMNLVFDASSQRKPQTHSNTVVTNDCLPVLLTSQTDMDCSLFRPPYDNCKTIKQRIWFKFYLLINNISIGVETENICVLVSSNFIRASLLSLVNVSDISESLSVTAYRRLSDSDK